jgi:hypothetical protein
MARATIGPGFAMSAANTNVFVSYSRADASLVAPVVKLLRVNKSLVFQDVDNVEPGKRWRGEIARGLADSHLVVVFWCSHASRSDEVAREWQAAVAQNKDLLPLLLDATPLPAALSEFQWIDFRDTVGASHAEVSAAPAASPAPAPQMPRAPRPAPVRYASTRWLSLAAGVAVFALAALLSVQLVNEDTPDDLPPIPSDTRPVPPVKQPDTGIHLPKPVPPKPKPAPPPPAPAPADWYFWPALTSGVASAVVLIWLWRRRRRSALATAPAAPTAGAEPPVLEVEKTIAKRLEAEILRRTAARWNT